MAIISQYPYVNEQEEQDNRFIEFYSDEGKLLIKLETGEEYEEAIDLYPSQFTYIEKEEPLEEEVIKYGRIEDFN